MKGDTPTRLASSPVVRHDSASASRVARAVEKSSIAVWFIAIFVAAES